MTRFASARRFAAACLPMLCAVSFWSLLPTMPAAAAGVGVDGGSETVFSWRTDRCDDRDTPDAPARAFRDGRGMVHLFATHFVDRASVGPRLDRVARDCRIVFEGGRNDDPAAFDDRVWLAAFWSLDGETVHALAHAEYHGHLRPMGCPSRRYPDCWWNTIVQLVSTDGGASFRKLEARRGLVAALPYPYDGPQGHPTGYFSPSGIVEHDGFLYAFVFAAARGAQQRGACLLRTDDIGDPTQWRAWDGAGFGARFVDPYAPAEGPPEAFVCAPVPGLPSTVTSLVQAADGEFLALYAASGPDAAGKAARGVWLTHSRDLLHWTRGELVLAAPMMFDFGCDAPAVYAYPSLIDPESSSRTFATVGERPFLYLTRFAPHGCRLTMDRDLVRFPLSLH